MHTSTQAHRVSSVSASALSWLSTGTLLTGAYCAWCQRKTRVTRMPSMPSSLCSAGLWDLQLGLATDPCKAAYRSEPRIHAACPWYYKPYQSSGTRWRQEGASQMVDASPVKHFNALWQRQQRCLSWPFQQAQRNAFLHLLEAACMYKSSGWLACAIIRPSTTAL